MSKNTTTTWTEIASECSDYDTYSLMRSSSGRTAEYLLRHDPSGRRGAHSQQNGDGVWRSVPGLRRLEPAEAALVALRWDEPEVAAEILCAAEQIAEDTNPMSLGSEVDETVHLWCDTEGDDEQWVATHMIDDDSEKRQIAVCDDREDALAEAIEYAQKHGLSVVDPSATKRGYSLDGLWTPGDDE